MIAALAAVAFASDAPAYPKPAYAAYPAYPKTYDYVRHEKLSFDNHGTKNFINLI